MNSGVGGCGAGGGVGGGVLSCLLFVDHLPVPEWVLAGLLVLDGGLGCDMSGRRSSNLVQGFLLFWHLRRICGIC